MNLKMRTLDELMVESNEKTNKRYEKFEKLKLAMSEHEKRIGILVPDHPARKSFEKMEAAFTDWLSV